MKHPFTMTERELRDRYRKRSTYCEAMETIDEWIAREGMAREKLIFIDEGGSIADEPTAFDRVMALRELRDDA